MGPKEIILNAVKQIRPFDDLETTHKEDVLRWIMSGEQIFRISKPANPGKHLVAYFVVFDKKSNSLLLCDHIKSGLLLPTGGHVEVDEDPRQTVIRETKEELGIDVGFEKLEDQPLFITSTITKGQGKHTDISLWYVIDGVVNNTFEFDRTEFTGVKWLSFEEVLNTNIQLLDPQMHRFVQKLKRYTVNSKSIN